MYFLKYQPLKEKLRNRALTDREALPYFILFCTLCTLAYSFPLIEKFNRWNFISGVLSVITGVGGVLYAYRENGGRAGYDLIQKYVVLGWVVSFRCLIVLVPIVIGLYIVGVMFSLIKDTTGWFDTLFLFVAEIFVYQRVGRHIRDTRSP